MPVSVRPAAPAESAASALAVIVTGSPTVMITPPGAGHGATVTPAGAGAVTRAGGPAGPGVTVTVTAARSRLTSTT